MKSINGVMKPIKRPIVNLQCSLLNNSCFFRQDMKVTTYQILIDYHQWLTIRHPESVSAEQPLHTSPFNPDEMLNNQE